MYFLGLHLVVHNIEMLFFVLGTVLQSDLDLLVSYQT
jgi:hypothetical protein